MPISLPTTFNPADKGPSTAIDATERVLTAIPGLGSSFARSHSKVSSGKWYVEMTRAVGSWMFGVSSALGTLNNYCGATGESIGLYDGTVYQGGSVAGSLGGVYTGGTFGLAIDADARTVRYLNATHTTGDIALTLPGDIYLAAGPDSSPTGTLSLNAGQDAFVYPVPSGYTPGFEPVSRLVFAGYITDENGDPTERMVRAHARSTGAVVGQVMSDPTTGGYLLIPIPNEAVEHTIYAMHDELNALIWDRVIPV